MTLYLFDLLGVAVFAVSGALAAGRARLDLIGVIVIAAITAIGGGTLRDVILDRHPIFWIVDPIYLPSSSVRPGHGRLRPRSPPPSHALRGRRARARAVRDRRRADRRDGRAIPDIVVLGTITGVAGGVLRDVLIAEVPLILRADIYATAAIVRYLALLAPRVAGRAAPVGVRRADWRAVVTLRLLSIVWRVQLPGLPPRPNSQSPPPVIAPAPHDVVTLDI